MRLAIDIDGCLANFTKAFGRLLVAELGKDLLPAGWMEDPTYPRVWDWDLAVGYTPEESRQVWQKVTSDRKFWYDLEALPLAQETVRRLSKLEYEGHDIYYITNRPGVRAKQQTELWLYDHGMYRPTVLVAGDKAPILQSLKIDAFVDDRLDTVNDVARRIEEGDIHCHLRVYLVDKAYNREGRRAGYTVVDSVKTMLMEEGLW